MSGDNKDGKKLGLLLIASLSVIVLLYCIIRLALYSLKNYEQDRSISELKELKNNAEALTPTFPASSQSIISKNTETISDTDEVLLKYRTLYSDNSDLAGWIKVDGTKIDYPVMQTVSDEEYYLHRNFKRLSSDEGLPFADARCDLTTPGENVIIYGHNMKNGDMFADLLKYEDEDFFNSHSSISFDTLFDEKEYKVISVFRTDVSADCKDGFRFYEFVKSSSERSLTDFIAEAVKNSIYKVSFDPGKVKGLLTLCTCEYSNKDGRFVVIAADFSQS